MSHQHGREFFSAVAVDRSGDVDLTGSSSTQTAIVNQWKQS
jgi:hypothetical protein